MTEEKKKKKTEGQVTPEERSTKTHQKNEEGAEVKTDIEEKVTIPLKDYADQLEEIDHLKQQSDEFSDGWQRERAEFANYRKRVARDQEQERLNFRIDIIKRYLVVHDDFERALAHIPPEFNGHPWLDGVQLIYQKLKNLLDGEGIQPIPAENTAFNPELHEAISHEENPDFESEQIIEVVQQGYAIGDRVIRPALVRVAK